MSARLLNYARFVARAMLNVFAAIILKTRIGRALLFSERGRPYGSGPSCGQPL